jgi:transcriptional regulator with XRE-family HTH domain
MSMTLKVWLKAKKRSQAEFGREIGMSQGAISKLVNGKHIPSPSAMQRIFVATRKKVAPNDWVEAAYPE